MADKAKDKTKEKAQEKSTAIPYHKVTITCACGASFEAGSTIDNIRVDICSQCHPFFTGSSKVVDAEGRIEKFKKKYKLK